MLRRGMASVALLRVLCGGGIHLLGDRFSCDATLRTGTLCPNLCQIDRSFAPPR
ncbi:MAG: hypothetical protein QOH35_5330 [Acidobacteriaceae bacterium]|jgi:hypothetical protein|nr:hypothetical protein [Acidobacteriaceae bacterium]MEA2543964.1 hypothetical protein [Acidobacteriaceae bacterium]